jgi:uncharacterized membrane protein
MTMGRVSIIEIAIILTVVVLFFAAAKRAHASRDISKRPGQFSTILPMVDMAVVVTFASILTILVLLFTSLT